MIDIRAAFISVGVVIVFLLLLKLFSFIHKCYVAYIQLHLLVWQNLAKGHELHDAKSKALEDLKKLHSFTKKYQDVN
jgi:hypothetical protein